MATKQEKVDARGVELTSDDVTAWEAMDKAVYESRHQQRHKRAEHRRLKTERKRRGKDRVRNRGKGGRT